MFTAAVQAVSRTIRSSLPQSFLVCWVGTGALCDTFVDALRVDTANIAIRLNVGSKMAAMVRVRVEFGKAL